MSTGDLSFDSYDSTPPRGSGPVWTRVYRQGGKYAHLLEVGMGCSRLRHYYLRDAGDMGWLGTGTQDEYDTAAAMPLCPECFARREARIDDPRLGAGHGREMT